MRKIEIPAGELRRLYEKQKLTTYKIANIFNCDPSVIQKRLKEYDIPTRRRVVKISKGELKLLYLRKNLSTYQIAKLYNCCPTSIYMKLRVWGIKTRPRKVVNIPKSVLHDLYIKKNLPLSHIARKYNCASSGLLRKMRKYGIKTRGLSEANMIYPKNKFSGDMIERAYMIGFRLGDLYARRGKYQVIIKTNTTKIEQVNLIKNVYGKYGHFYCKKTGHVFYVQCFLDKSFSFLVQKQDRIEEWIMKKDRLFFAFLAGYIDAEGNIGIYSGRARFRVGSYDKHILWQVYQKLEKLNIHCKYRLESKAGKYNQNKDFYRVSVNHKFSLMKLIECISPYLKHSKRFKDITIAKKNIMARNEKYGIKGVFIKDDQGKVLRHDAYLLHQ